ncbi:TetR family transcriptional regulator [Metabacillus litoralis]|uniref:TetR family transcriptional regulator n=1 Tax=Metabacillus litoralis TaxID=152268 RepID=UPI001CFE689D|nr:TetR family transcriptional regulator [Metabacillus litoralis]
MEFIESILYKSNPEKGKMELLDADWTDNFGLLVAFRENNNLIVQYKESQIMLSNVRITCKYPLVRWISFNSFLIADARNDGETDNLYIFNTDGTLRNSFHCGDGIEDIVVSNDGIWISYFDEGVFGEGISTEGLVLFSYEGTPIFKYHSDLSGRPFIVDCYAICKGDSSSIWLFPYTDFPLLQVNSINKTIHSFKTPKILHGSNSLCVRGKYAYFHDRYNSNGELYSWEIGKRHPHLIGNIKGTTRGLGKEESHHFISIDDLYVKTYRIINHKEYE